MCNSTTQRCPKEIMKIFLIEDFCHLPPVSMTLVVHLELRISPQIFEKIRNGPNGITRGGGKLIHVENLKLKISWHCPFKVTAPSHTAVSTSEMNSQPGMEIHLAVGIGSTYIGFFKGKLSFPILFEEPPVFLHWSQQRYRHHRAGFIAPLPTKNNNIFGLKSSLETDSKLVYRAVANSRM
jgi:hypothetical protein